MLLEALVIVWADVFLEICWIKYLHTLDRKFGRSSCGSVEIVPFWEQIPSFGIKLIFHFCYLIVPSYSIFSPHGHCSLLFVFISIQLQRDRALWGAGTCLFRTDEHWFWCQTAVTTSDLPGLSGVRVCVLCLAGQQRTSHVRVQPNSPYSLK